MFLNMAAIGGIRREFQVTRKVGAGGGHMFGLQVDQAALAVLFRRIGIGLQQQTQDLERLAGRPVPRIGVVFRLGQCPRRVLAPLLTTRPAEGLSAGQILRMDGQPAPPRLTPGLQSFARCTVSGGYQPTTLSLRRYDTAERDPDRTCHFG
jgi:hypothetical protein